VNDTALIQQRRHCCLCHYGRSKACSRNTPHNIKWRVRPRLIVFITIFQTVLFLGHLFIYQTWDFFWRAPDPPGISPLQLTLAILSISFVAASLLAFRYHNVVVRWFYTISAIWLGTASFLLFAAAAAWVIYALAWLARIPVNGRLLAATLFTAAIIVSLFGVINAAWTRVRRITVKLPNLPAVWRGRTAALISDLHLGHVRNSGFARRMVAKIARLNPAMVWISGDLYDGTAVDAEHAAAPLRDLNAPLGAYFVEGNHEEFTNPEKYLTAIRSAGVHVLNNEKTEVDGLQIVGVPYRHATHPGHFRSVLDAIGVDRTRASVLLTHAPDQVGVSEAAGIGLQVSGHTHLGQFIPYTWIAKRIYREFVYGLNRVGRMLVYTSSGAGTWGPPLRVGSAPEIVLFQFE
jgi:predicted MPP superfamily phosphohydrolase